MCRKGIWAAVPGLVLAVSALCGYAPAGAAVAARQAVETTKVAEGVYTFRHVNHRNMFVVTAEGVIATDPINTAAAKAMMGEIRKITDKPIKYVVYSHEHWDHARGGKIFKEAGAQFVAQERCVTAWKSHLHPDADVVMPDVTFRDRHTLTLGGTTLDLYYFGPNHGQCLTVMHLPKERLVFVVDLVVPKRIGLRGWTTTDPGAAARTMREIEKLSFDRFIPGHGPAVAPVSDMRDVRQYVEDLIAAVREAFEKHKSVAKVRENAKDIKLPKYEKWTGYKEYLQGNVERVITYYWNGQ